MRGGRREGKRAKKRDGREKVENAEERRMGKEVQEGGRLLNRYWLDRREEAGCFVYNVLIGSYNNW